MRPVGPQEDAHLVLTITGFVGAVWQIRGPRHEGLSDLNQALDHPDNQSPTADRA